MNKIYKNAYIWIVLVALAITYINEPVEWEIAWNWVEVGWKTFV